jgi:sphingolipid delta-4 desaturase
MAPKAPDASAPPQVAGSTFKQHPKATPVPGAKNLDILDGDHGVTKAIDLQDFIWSMSDEPHASRRKMIIKDIPEVKALMGFEWKTKYITAALVGAQIYLAYLMRDEVWKMSFTFWATAYFIGAVITQALFLANHEISHNLAFKSFDHNKLLGCFANTAMVVPYFMMFKNYHNEHHKYQGVEGVDTDLPTALEGKILKGTPGKLFYMFFQIWFYALRPCFVRSQELTRWHAINWIVVLTSDAIIYSLWGLGPIIYLLVCLHLAGSWHPIAAHFLAEHITFAGELETASYYGWMNWLTWNVGYHNEHHDFPNVPWSRLPALRKSGAVFYDQIPYHKSWVGALYRFLFDPSVSLYNRVKRTSGGPADFKAAQAKAE